MKLWRLIIVLSLGFCNVTHALVLEDLIAQGALAKALENKTLGYYVGSFNPVHFGHKNVAKAALTVGCDYVLICPVWGGDGFKNRLPVERRLDMLFLMFQDHPNIIVTRMNPQDMQRALTVVDTSQRFGDKCGVTLKIRGLKIWGVLGADAMLDTLGNKKKQSVYMRGIEIPIKYRAHSAGSVIALPAEAFVVVNRKGIDTAHKGMRFDSRKIAAVVDTNDKGISSTQIRKLIKAQKSTEALLSPKVQAYINANKLY